MPNQKDHKSRDNLKKCYNVVRQSSANGVSAVEIAERLGIDRTTVHRHLARLLLMEKVESKNGIWFAKTTKRTTKPLEKEIVIELPMPKNQWQQVALLEMLARDCEEHKFPRAAEMYRIPLEKLKETRTIKIKGKNVDNLDLEKVQSLIVQANQKGSKFNLKGFLKGLKRSRANNSQRE